jgi:hypothetical protein
MVNYLNNLIYKKFASENDSISNNFTYVRQNNLRGKKLIKFWLKVIFVYIKAYLRLIATLYKKECYYGVFKGEFGHFLGHNLPFLMYLYSKGVKINYCGLEIHKPFMIDDKGNKIYKKFYALRDFFNEVKPSCNSVIPPDDVQLEIKKFEDDAKKSKLPFWNISDEFYYWFVHRSFLLKGFTYTYELDKFYADTKENSCCLFPRKINNFTKNQGRPWDYKEVIKVLLKHFDKVYICGHSAHIEEIDINDNNRVFMIKNDNYEMLKAVSKSKLIVTPHSGVVYLGEYVSSDILIIYDGASSPNEIGSIRNTLRFKKQFKGKSKFYYAFNLQQIDDLCNKIKTKIKTNEKIRG